MLYFVPEQLLVDIYFVLSTGVSVQVVHVHDGVLAIIIYHGLHLEGTPNKPSGTTFPIITSSSCTSVIPVTNELFVKYEPFTAYFVSRYS